MKNVLICSGAFLLSFLIAGNRLFAQPTFAGPVSIGGVPPTSSLNLNVVDGILLYKNASTGSLGSVRFDGIHGPSGTQFTGPSIVAIKETSTYQTGLLFNTTSNVGAVQESMRIDGNGNIGIGTTSPEGKLHLSGTAGANMFGISSYSLPTSGDEAAVFMIKTNHDNNLWSQSTVSYGTTGKGLRVYNHGGTGYTAFEVVQSGGSRLIVDGVGNVGIGTITPSHKLSVDVNISAKGNSQKNNCDPTGLERLCIRTHLSPYPIGRN